MNVLDVIFKHLLKIRSYSVTYLLPVFNAGATDETLEMWTLKNDISYYLYKNAGHLDKERLWAAQNVYIHNIASMYIFKEK